ncbi:hypothetical protein BGX28_004506, partial [Mortierella sp. GBA30]
MPPTFTTLPPEIHLGIQHNLSYKDLLSCILISKKFSSLYSSSLWHTMCAYDLDHIWPPSVRNSNGSCFENKEHQLEIKQILQKYSHHIRSLAVYSIASFQDLGPICTNLTSLRLGMPGEYETSPTRQLLDGFEESSIQKISNTLMWNKCLRSVRLKLSYKSDPEPIILALTKLRFLDEIDIDWKPTQDDFDQLAGEQGLKSRLCAEHLFRILEGCRHLLRLRLAGCLNLNSGVSVPIGKSHPLLRELNISRCGSFHRDHSIWKMLSLCPTVVSVALPGELSKDDVEHLRNIVLEHCPLIESLSFIDDLPGADGPEHGDIGEIIAAVQKLKHLIIRHATIPQSLSLVDMLQPHASQLESIELVRLYEVGLQASDVPLLLASLPRLKRFVSDTPLSLRRIFDVYRATKVEPSTSPSESLRTLNIRVTRLREEDEQLGHGDQDEFMGWISSSFRNLESLVIRQWDPTRYMFAPVSREVGLDIARAQSSLRSMLRLKHLEIFDKT